MNLRTRLALVTAALIVAGLGLGLAITYGVLVTNSNAALDREGAILAELIGEAVALRGENAIRVPPIVESYLTNESGVRSAQVFLDGQLLWEGGVLDAPRPLDALGLTEGRGERSVSGWRVVTTFDEGTGITVQVGSPLAGPRETLEPFARLAVPLTLSLSLLAGLAAWASVGIALAPLRTLTEAVGRLEDGAEVPTISGSDEPARLARSFSRLHGRLTRQRKREREFLEYAAHELRTPLAALRAGIDHARRQEGTAQRDTLDRLRKEVTRLNVLAQNLLALSRAESADVRRDSVDLASIAAAAYDRFQPLAVEKGLALSLEETPAVARADARLLDQAIDNLLANAIRSTTVGGVTIRTGVHEDGAYLAVDDTGPGFPAELREGLGLRVVRAVAKAHDGRLDLNGDTGASAVLWLPAT